MKQRTPGDMPGSSPQGCETPDASSLRPLFGNTAAPLAFYSDQERRQIPHQAPEVS